MENTNLANEDWETRLNLLREKIDTLRGEEWQALIEEDRLGEVTIGMITEVAKQVIATNQNLQDLSNAAADTDTKIATAVRTLGDQQDALHKHMGILISMVKSLQKRLDRLEENQ